MSSNQIKEFLTQLRWKEDQLVYNCFGEHVWLKPYFNKANERIGITDCCLANFPCERHKYWKERN